jgi:hypothetical protein
VSAGARRPGPPKAGGRALASARVARRLDDCEAAIRPGTSAAVRPVPSSLPGPDGVDRPAPQTFASKREAEVWLTRKEGEIKRGDWLDPSAGSVPFAKYAADWMGQGQFSPKTAQLYELLLRLHLVPTFGEMNIADIRQEDVRTPARDAASHRPATGPAIRARDRRQGIPPSARDPQHRGTGQAAQ